MWCDLSCGVHDPPVLVLLRLAPQPSIDTSDSITKVSQNSGHFLKFIWADVRTEGKAKVDEHPLPMEVFVGLLLSVVVCEGEGATQGRLAKRLGSLLLSSCVAGQSPSEVYRLWSDPQNVRHHKMLIMAAIID